METVTDILNWLDGWLGAAFYFPYLLLGVGLFFTIYLGVPQVRYFKHAWGVLFGRHTRKDAAGDTSHLQALSTALSGTVGTGNIAGVAFAIFLGGPAALFWMWATAFVGMTTKFVEVTISHKYRTFDDKGEVAGGPMYYMERGLNMKWLAVFFAVATVLSTLGSGNMPQSNSVSAGLRASFDIPPAASGAVLAILLALVIIGGIKRIARVATAIVPIMGVLYAVGACAVVASNIEQVVPSFLAVFRDAFTGSAATGGFLGASVAYAINRGVARGLFSNEAGQGSAPIAHASARADEPVSEGLVSLLEPFIDTLVICTLTGMVILSSGVWQEKFDNEFQRADTEFLAGVYSEREPEDLDKLATHIGARQGLLDGLLGRRQDRTLPMAEGVFAVRDGRFVDADITVLHNRSVAEDVLILTGGVPHNGDVTLVDGALTDDATARGKSLLHSVPLTAEAFKRSFFGFYGQYAVTVGLVLFAFSTAVAWSYYGDRAITYLFGSTRAVLPYRILYAAAFFCAAWMDTSFVWLISTVSLALMALPNLFGIVLLRREARDVLRDYSRRLER